jgi:hypothetical protein
MKNIFTAFLLISFVFSAQVSIAQYGSFGKDTCPDDSTEVNDIIYYGELLDMSGGYQVGDTVFDFTVYDFEGNSINLYEELSGSKPVVLVNGSVSCLRFRGTFEPDNNGQQYIAARNYLESHVDDINWIFVYGVEAHPTDGNCPSNCPPTVSNDTTVIQPPYYVNRRWAAHGWEESPEHEFPFTMYADNADNAVYDNFFQRPFGMLAINCNGTVAMRGDWVNSFFMDAISVFQLDAWRTEGTTCSIEWTPEDAPDDDVNDDSGSSGNSDDSDDSSDDDSSDDDSSDDDSSDDDSSDDDSSDDDSSDDDSSDDDSSDDDSSDDDSSDDDSSDDDSSDDDSSDDDSSDDDSSDDDSSDDDSSDDDGSDESDTYDGPSEAITIGNGANGSVSTIESNSKAKVRIYPNPVQELLQIEGIEGRTQLRLVDISGRTIWDAQTAQNTLSLNVSQFKPGNYILLIQQDAMEPERASLIIQ